MYFYKMGLVALCIFLFQNCSSFEASKEFNVYSYATQPDFFYDLKLVSVEIDSLNRELYVFDLVVSYAKDFAQAVNYQIGFSTLQLPGVCQTITGVATGVSKHTRFQCLLPTADSLFVQITLVGRLGEEVVEQYKF